MIRRIVSFGFKYGDDPPVGPGVVILDVRQLFRNPHHDRTLRYLRGTDTRVQDDIRKTPNFNAKVEHLVSQATQPGVQEVWIGCHGGHHRSVFLAELLGQAFKVPVEHRDIVRR